MTQFHLLLIQAALSALAMSAVSVWVANRIFAPNIPPVEYRRAMFVILFCLQFFSSPQLWRAMDWIK